MKYVSTFENEMMRMIKYLAFTFIIFFFNLNSNETRNVKSPNDSIIGLWQKNDTIIGSALDDCYRIYPDSTFIFTFSAFLDFNKIICLKGCYKIEDGYLYTLIKSREEYEGDIIRGSPDWQTEWILDDSAKIISIEQKNSKWEKIRMKFKKLKHSTVIYLELDCVKYFKISNNPNEMKDEH
jgi:hypothetical protein